MYVACVIFKAVMNKPKFEGMSENITSKQLIKFIEGSNGNLLASDTHLIGGNIWYKYGLRQPKFTIPGLMAFIFSFIVWM